MNTLSLNEMQTFSGGNAYIGGFCTGSGLVRLAASAGLVAVTPIGGGILLGISAGCLGYALYKGLS